MNWAGIVFYSCISIVGSVFVVMGCALTSDGLSAAKGIPPPTRLLKLASMVSVIFGGVVALSGVLLVWIAVTNCNQFLQPLVVSPSARQLIVQADLRPKSPDGGVAIGPVDPLPIGKLVSANREPPEPAADAIPVTLRAEITEVVPVQPPASPLGIAKIPFSEPMAFEPVPR